VKAPRFRIAWVMVAVAIAALDFWATRGLLDLRPRRVGGLLLLGALPMANVLAVGLLVARQLPRSRPFVLGFEQFGAVALFFLIFLVISNGGESLRDNYLTPMLAPLRPAESTNHILIGSAVAVMLILPQVLFALIGGALFSWLVTRAPRY
jgi:hypothetical protein